MAFEFFRVPINDDGSAAAELNAFKRSHRVLHTDRRFVEMGENSAWVFCLDYWEASESPPTAKRQRGRNSRDRVDYREELPDPQFLVFSDMRVWRAEAAQRENVPRYMLFVDRQLADMVEQRVLTMEALSKIRGVGAERLQKYGPEVLEQLKASWAKHDAKSEPTVEPDSGSK